MCGFDAVFQKRFSKFLIHFITLYMPLKQRQEVYHVYNATNYKECVHCLPFLDFDEIPNLGDHVILTNNEIAIITRLKYHPPQNKVIYSVKLKRNDTIIANLQSISLQLDSSQSYRPNIAYALL